MDTATYRGVGKFVTAVIIIIVLALLGVGALIGGFLSWLF
jgi:hypothetical protein